MGWLDRWESGGTPDPELFLSSPGVTKCLEAQEAQGGAGKQRDLLLSTGSKSLEDIMHTSKSCFSIHLKPEMN